MQYVPPKKTIIFETYIYWSGRIGNEFSGALTARSRVGVAVKVMIDWARSIKMENALLNKLVVDGTVGFTVGAGIADRWSGNVQHTDH